MFKSLKIIVCCDAKEGIGFEDKLPWNVAEEMRLFRDKTIGNKNNCVIMGRATFESIPEKYRPLKDRHHYVLSRNEGKINHQNVEVVHSIESLLEKVESSTFDEYWVIGGKSIYETFLCDPMMDHVDEIHLSILHEAYTCDTFLPVMTRLRDRDTTTMQKTIYKEFTHYIICQNRDYL